MDMVARRSGLSKSSLYGHFKNRQDMLRQLFMTEFERIFAFSRQGIEKSSVSVEQLYLGVFSIAVYLRSRPEILVTMDWIRTRNLNLGVHKPQEQVFFRFFDGIEIEYLRKNRPVKRRPLYHWILFLIISTLMHRRDGRSLGKLQNRDIRDLFRFLTLGVGGFKIK
jgi:AcrR family transcriptional regulator